MLIYGLYQKNEKVVRLQLTVGFAKDHVTSVVALYVLVHTPSDKAAEAFGGLCEERLPKNRTSYS